MQQFCNSCDEYRDVVIDSDCTSCVWHKAIADTEERIIKLVERFGFNEELGFSFEQAKEDLLTLIKGEK